MWHQQIGSKQVKTSRVEVKSRAIPKAFISTHCGISSIFRGQYLSKFFLDKEVRVHGNEETCAMWFVGAQGGALTKKGPNTSEVCVTYNVAQTRKVLPYKRNLLTAWLGYNMDDKVVQHMRNVNSAKYIQQSFTSARGVAHCLTYKSNE